MLRLFTGNRSPSIQDTVKVNGTAFDLTGATVRFRMRDRRSSTLLVDEAATVVDAAAGTVRWDPQDADVATSGHYVCWWAITLPSSLEQDSDEFTLWITDHAPGSSVDLCTIDDVNQAMEPTSSTSNRDPRIQELITEASIEIMRRLERELAPRSTNLTRTFEVPIDGNRRRGVLVDLAPYDLRTATSVILHPGDADAVPLTSDDYTLSPVGAPQGGYNRLRVSQLIPIISTFTVKFGYAQLQITGDWGLFDTLTVPDDIRGAAVLCVRAWLRQNTSASQPYSGVGDLVPLQPAVPQTFEIPRAAWLKLAAWQRKTA